jgi:N4-gp56 family major capsid protein
MYNDPANLSGTGAVPSGVGTQLRTDYYHKKALIEAKRAQYFMPLADVTAMPKNMGKTIKKYHYLPLLDDRNINDQGIDASGATIADGNLYGSSKDVGTISGKLPVLSEAGGRVNRVGFKRVEIEGSIAKFGFFDEYTQESLDFDTDEELEMHVNREMVYGAHEITEDALQIDLLNGAGVIRYAGAATSNATIDETCEVTYGDLMRLAIDLDNNRTPKQTKIITGSRMVDTRVIDSCRVMYIGSELIPLIKGMTDLHGNQAFIPVQQYASAGELLNGEIGTIDQFRIVVVPEMLKWAGAGADASTTTSHYETGDKYDVFPMLVVGDGSFTTIGFQTDGKTVKFKITHKKPGKETADRSDPYGETGFMSIKWYYGSLILRPERLALIKTAAPL